MVLNRIKEAIGKINLLSNNKPVRVISHFDTDGITSAAIFSRALDRWEKKFSVQIVKNLEEKTIEELPEDQILIFLDLASGSLNYLEKKKTEIFIFDHHEITQHIPENVFMINSTMEDSEPMSSAAICYIFARELSFQNKDLASLAVIGMIGDLFEKNIGKVFSEIIKDSDTLIKKGLMIYPSTRPLDRALEYNFSPYIPGISGSREGVLDLLREAGLNGKKDYKALYELTEDEMRQLVTSILLRIPKKKDQENLIGNLFLIRFFSKLEDARELSALINACSRMDYPEVALGFCLGNKNCREMAEKIYITYKQSLISALRHVSEAEKIQGRDYMIINSKDQIKDTIIGTVASIISHSPVYEEGTIIVALAYNQDKIKVSARIRGKTDKNVRELLAKAVVPIGGEVGGHPNAAGCLISKEKEDDFILELKKVLDVELVKV